MKEFCLGSGKPVEVKPGQTIVLEAAIACYEREDVCLPESKPETLKEMIELTNRLYLFEAKISLAELDIFSRWFLSYKDQFRAGLTDPERELEVINCLANALGDSFPAVQAATESEMEQWDILMNKLTSTSMSLGLERLEAMVEPMQLSEDYAFFLFKAISGCLWLGLQADEFKTRAVNLGNVYQEQTETSFQKFLAYCKEKSPLSFVGENEITPRLHVKLLEINRQKVGVFESLLREGDIEVIKKAFKLLFNPKDFGEESGRELTDEGKEILRIVCEKLGLYPDSLLQAWLDASYNEALKPRDNIAEAEDHDQTKAFNSLNVVTHENIFRLLTIESIEPGSAKNLHQCFGISNFARFNESFLINQHNESSQSLPYGLYITATFDPNGALTKDQNIIDSMLEKLSGKYLLRVIEVKSKFDLTRKLVYLKHKYGTENLINFAVIDAHGTESSISLGAKKNLLDPSNNDFSTNRIQVSDLLGPGMARSGEHFFVDDVSIAVLACSTGVGGGLASIASEKINANFIAPDADTDTRGIEIKLNGDRVDLEPVYGRAKAERYYRRIK